MSFSQARNFMLMSYGRYHTNTTHVFVFFFFNHQSVDGVREAVTLLESYMLCSRNQYCPFRINKSVIISKDKVEFLS